MLSTNFELLELLKLPLLVEHFKEHKAWDPELSVAGFIYMHYFQDDNQYGDQQRDMEMPFKTSPHSSAAFVCFIMPSPDITIVSKLVYQEAGKTPITNSADYSAQYLSSIWQPPRFC